MQESMQQQEHHQQLALLWFAFSPSFFEIDFFFFCKLNSNFSCNSFIVLNSMCKPISLPCSVGFQNYCNQCLHVCGFYAWLVVLDAFLMGYIQCWRGCFNRTWHSLFPTLCEFKRSSLNFLLSVFLIPLLKSLIACSAYSSGV